MTAETGFRSAPAKQAGLRHLAGRAEVWAPPALDERARRQEGWIFGVGTGG